MPCEIYLDNNATSRPLPAVVDRVTRYLGDTFGNPSSPHGSGRDARHALARAREQVARLLGAEPESIVFMSGATEANNTVLRLLMEPDIPPRLVTTLVEHSSILETASWLEQRGVDVSYLRVDDRGRVSPAELLQALEKPTGLVSVQWANSETGTLQPIEELGEICQRHRVPFHVDAAQAVGRVPIAFRDIPVDFLTFTGHKLHGPQGTGAVCARNANQLPVLLYGGDQESGQRAGTENLPGLMGLAEAARIRHEGLGEAIAFMGQLRDRFEKSICQRIGEASVNGDTGNRVCNTTNICFSGIDGQAIMAQLDQAGILCSQTSACTTYRPEPSRVLTAMGLSEEEAFASVRFSFSILNTIDEVDSAIDRIAEICGRFVGLTHT